MPQNREAALASARAFFHTPPPPDSNLLLFRVRADIFVLAESSEDAEQIVCDLPVRKVETFSATVVRQSE